MEKQSYTDIIRPIYIYPYICREREHWRGGGTTEYSNSQLVLLRVFPNLLNPAPELSAFVFGFSLFNFFTLSLPLRAHHHVLPPPYNLCPYHHDQHHRLQSSPSSPHLLFQSLLPLARPPAPSH